MGLAFLVHLGQGQVAVRTTNTPDDVSIVSNRDSWHVKGHVGWGEFQIGSGVRVHDEGELPLGTIFAYRPSIGDEQRKAAQIITEASETGRLVIA